MQFRGCGHSKPCSAPPGRSWQWFSWPVRMLTWRSISQMWRWNDWPAPCGHLPSHVWGCIPETGNAIPSAEVSGSKFWFWKSGCRECLAIDLWIFGMLFSKAQISAFVVAQSYVRMTAAWKAQAWSPEAHHPDTSNFQLCSSKSLDVEWSSPCGDRWRSKLAFGARVDDAPVLNVVACSRRASAFFDMVRQECAWV